jgi:hypothetical protein
MENIIANIGIERSDKKSEDNIGIHLKTLTV